MHHQNQFFSPQLTIVVCTYNAADHLTQCLLSIISQKTPQTRLHIIDGGSSDSTSNIVKSMGDAVDFFSSERDGGVYDAMNKAATDIKNGWVLFLGADDRLLPNVLPRLIKILEQSIHTNILYYGNVYRPSTNSLYDGEFSSYKLMRRNICQQAILYPHSVLNSEGFDLKFPINADHILNIKTFFNPEIEKKYIPICISHYEDISEGISRNRRDKDLLKARRGIALELGSAFHFLFASAIDSKEWLRKKIYTFLNKFTN